MAPPRDGCGEHPAASPRGQFAAVAVGVGLICVVCVVWMFGVSRMDETRTTSDTKPRSGECTPEIMDPGPGVTNTSVQSVHGTTSVNGVDEAVLVPSTKAPGIPPPPAGVALGVGEVQTTEPSVGRRNETATRKDLAAVNTTAVVLRLLDATGTQSWAMLLRGAFRSGGPEALLKCVTEWEEALGDAAYPRKSSVRLGRSIIEYQLGQRAQAASDLRDAILGMEPCGKARPKQPPLRCLTSSPYGLPMSEAEEEVWRQRGPFGDNTETFWGQLVLVMPLASDNVYDYQEWLLSTGASHGDPEIAMSAVVWAHSLAIRVRGFRNGLSPAAKTLILSEFPGTDTAQNSLEENRRLLGVAYEHRLAEGDASAVSLRDEYERARKNVWSLWCAEVLWSLRVQILDGFPQAHSPGAERIRALARSFLESE